MKCNNKYCKLGGEVTKEEGIKYNNKYYHSECLKIVKDKQEIVRLYLEQINPNETKAMLNKSIYQLIHQKGYSSDYVLFIINYTIKNQIKLNNPFGLHYVVTNTEAIKQYKEQILRQKAKIIEDNIKSNEFNNKEVEFSYKPSQKPKWLEIKYK